MFFIYIFESKRIFRLCAVRFADYAGSQSLVGYDPRKRLKRRAEDGVGKGKMLFFAFICIFDL
jgi:hypothetical protein